MHMINNTQDCAKHEKQAPYPDPRVGGWNIQVSVIDLNILDPICMDFYPDPNFS